MATILLELVSPDITPHQSALSHSEMTLSDAFRLASAILVSLGGGAAIVLALSSWLGKVWANRILESDKAKYAQELEDLKSRYLRDTEKYKTSLKKSEFIFEKEYQAASEFVALVRAVLPTYTHPDMDWYDACDQMALAFESSEKALGQFLSKHGAVLTERTRDMLRRCIAAAADGKFHVGPNGQVDPQANKLAAEFYDNLEETERSLLAVVHDQSRV